LFFKNIFRNFVKIICGENMKKKIKQHLTYILSFISLIVLILCYDNTIILSVSTPLLAISLFLLVSNFICNHFQSFYRNYYNQNSFDTIKQISNRTYCKTCPLDNLSVAGRPATDKNCKYCINGRIMQQNELIKLSALDKIVTKLAISIIIALTLFIVVNS
jgi:hypothetical protein